MSTPHICNATWNGEPCPRTPTLMLPVECKGCGDRALWKLCQQCCDKLLHAEGVRLGICTECPGEVVTHEPLPLP